jgi:hypothetical protein
MGWCVLWLTLVAVPEEAVAQARVPAVVWLATQPRLSAFAVRLPGRGPANAGHYHAQAGSSRDSLKNGVILGAIVGAAALGAFGGLICKAQQEPEGPSCVPDTLRIAAVGAAVGVGAGLAIDAALTRRGGVALSFGLRFQTSGGGWDEPAAAVRVKSYLPLGRTSLNTLPVFPEGPRFNVAPT